jgi:cyclic beta-1,2-glucan synthetase
MPLGLLAPFHHAPPLRRPEADGMVEMPPDWTLLSLGAALAGAVVAFQQPTGHEVGGSADGPSHGEFLSREQLVEHVRELAVAHEVDAGRRRGEPLLRRVRESAQVLFKAYQDIAAAAKRQEAITPAAEWLLDNFHIVEDQLSDIRKHLPHRYYTQLPKLRKGTLAGYPRVYALALDLISHQDGALDEQSLVDCLRSYQSVAPLSIGELWAVPIMLRVGLVENLRRLTAPLEGQRIARVEADTWAERLTEAAGGGTGDVQVVLGELARRKSLLTGTHAVRLLQRLRGRGPAIMPALQWLEQHVRQEIGTSLDELVRIENQLQASSQVTISNTITSFRLLDTVDWTELFESVSVVEQILRRDPSGVYAGGDFRTRDACRHAVEGIAHRCRRPEPEVAEAALALAERGGQSAVGRGQSAGAAPASPASLGGPEGTPGSQPSTFNLQPSTRSRHIGYYLIGDGRKVLEREVGYRVGRRESLYRFVLAHPTGVYLGLIALFTLILTGFALQYAASDGAGAGRLLLTGLIALLPASDLAVNLANRLLTVYLPPRVLAKLDYSEGVPPEHRTLVVIPTLLTSEEAVDELLERLEVHYLANEDPNIHFALLTDYADADAQEQPEDVALLHRAVTGILQINERYEGSNAYTRFFLFHRPRMWNEAQGVWMGWERKRGKLMELNRLLRGADDTRYTVRIGDRAALQDVKYVICLDSDTQLPPDSARRLIGTMAHPLNQPVLDPALRRVVDGYGILQPRVSITLTSAARTLFTRIFSGNAGVDPYTTAVSDVYQDLFGEGIFCGKGIYEIDAFEAALEGRVGENALLSHDLFEGSFARCGLVTDIELFDDYPARYNTYSARQHRWIRGDWQLLPWLAPTVRTPEGARQRNPLSLIARWKIFDNLRRSLVAPGLLLLLAAGWLFLPGDSSVWSLAALLVVLFPIYAHLASALLIDPRGVPWTSYFWNVWYDALTNLQQVGLSLAFLAHQAWSSVDATGRTLWRLFVSHKNLLEWTSAAVAERRLGSDPRSFWVRMWPASAIAVVLEVAVLLFRQDTLPIATPLLASWALAPLLAWWVSRPIKGRLEPLTAAERTALRLTARRTWRFFEEFVTADENWLPPDNYQEDPPVVARRTSPTNIGLLLLSTLSARDLGYVGLLALADRLENTLWSTAKLERYRGHLFNWYETVNATAIVPHYISTVDSGNLAGHLLAMKQACLELVQEPVFSAQTLAGLRDTLAALRATLPSGSRWLKAECDTLERALQGDPHSGPQWQAQLAAIHEAATALEIAAKAPQSGDETPDPSADETREWTERLVSMTGELEQDMETLLPWVRLLLVQPAPFGDGRPLTGDLKGRPHVFGELVSPPGGKPRGLLTLSELMDRSLAELERLRGTLEMQELPEATRETARVWLGEVRLAFEKCRTERIRLLQRLHALAEAAHRMTMEMDFSFLYDEQRDLFAVGYDVAAGRLDRYHYDLLASECRLASFIAIAKRDVPQKHWFRMGRSLTAGGDRALVSWSGTMFEYLMPLLVMRAYDGTLLEATLPAVVRKQQRFAAREHVPWGVSESGFIARDQAMNYQYRAFGVPGLGLKPDLYEDLVVAPYATLLALPVCPKDASRNLEALTREGLMSRFGYYEAIDYTPSRLQRGQRGEVVRSYMAHHQGMGLVSLANYLFDNRMQERFHADPLVKSAELLLQERNPRWAEAAHPKTQGVMASLGVPRELPATSIRHFTTAQTSTPRAQLLSNGRYSVMVTNAGGSYSSWKGMAITRWREDVTRDHWGMFVYLRDLDTGEVWSAAQQPLRDLARDYEVTFTEDKADFQRRVEGIVSHLEIAVSPDDDAEVRRLTLVNTSDHERVLEITSYAEVVLAAPAADLAHTTFSNLFLETEFVAERTALLATRRPRSATQKLVWGVHVLAHDGVPADIWAETEYETDRAKFIGRGRSTADPIALEEVEPLSRSTGPVLDPIFCLRQKVRLPAHATVRLAFTTGAADTREEALRLAERYRDIRAAARTFELAWTHSQVELRHLNLSPDQAHLCQRLASRVLYVDSFVRPSPDVLARNTQGQSGLWAYGISGDVPIILAQVSSFEQIDLVHELLVAHEYLRVKGLAFDLVILNEHPPSYLQAFEQSLQEAARNSGAYLDQPGGVFIRRADQIPDAGRNLLLFVARAVFSGDHGSLADQLDWRPERREPPEEFAPSRAPLPPQHLPPPPLELPFYNGLGGFSEDGSEYVIQLSGRDQWTPAPWINVIANPRFGFLASEAGSGFTWSENSRENRLTPWSNDPVGDPSGEVVYLRHEDTGRLWSVTPLPIRETNPYVIRHGPGYTRYEHTSHGLEQDLLLFVPPDDSIKIYRLRVKNTTDRVQKLSATFYAEWVLGVAREQTARAVATSLDPDTGALIARNSYNGEFAQRVAFADVNRAGRTWTCDRTEFLGRNGSTRRPRALRRVELSGLAGGDLDPCAAIQVKFNLQPGAVTELVFTLGEGDDVAEARKLAMKYRSVQAVDDAWTALRAQWGEVLHSVQVKTPDPSLDLMLNRWLLYQTLACRVWARSAFYQSGGAYGFRDQLQDVMALAASGCSLGAGVARAQILLHAAHQFSEGDVQHWWHPPTGRGIRTRFSDDLLWLPYVTSYYVRTTGDASILSEGVPFIHGRLLAEGEDEYYDQPSPSGESATLYEHCLRALRKGLTSGAHGLPLMGTGDWNDGMNLVGNEGKGESVWVAWFLLDLLRSFTPLCEARGDLASVKQFQAEVERLRRAVEENAWDGAWYRRAYFDEGTPLGSSTNDECQIDSIAQSWAVISGAGDPQRARQAMEAVEQRLVREKDELILLFTPPFDKSALDPGYIKGYVPGVRENGGQYTHAALWTVMATALLGKGTRAHELYTMINPIHHASTAAEVERYRVEPYVVVADVYGAPPHTGRGGWTWYTGSASWMYRIGLEVLLGFQLHGNAFTVTPCIPADWPGFELTYRYGHTPYHVRVENPAGVECGVREVTLDGQPVPGGRIPLTDDRATHEVRVVMGSA